MTNSASATVDLEIGGQEGVCMMPRATCGLNRRRATISSATEVHS